jgi:fucose permease
VPVLLRQPLFLGALTAILLAGATEVGLAQWLPAFTERQLGYSKAAGAIALSGFSVGMVAGRVLAGHAGHHVKPMTLVAACCAVTAVLYGVGSLCPYAPLALAACVLVGLTNSAVWPTLLSVAADRFPHGGASMFALLAAAGNLGCVIMPWIIGVVSERAGLGYGLATVTLCPLLLLGIVLRMRRRQ